MYLQYLSQKVFFPILIVTLISICIQYFSVSAQEDELYLACNTTFNCSNMEGVGYPFWGPTRRDYCGHPKFELNCSGEAPVITINSTGYRVLGIDSSEHFLTVARTDYWNDSCPQEHKNATLDSTFFDYTSETQDLTLYYRCSSAVIVGVSSQFSCPNDGTTVTNLFATDNTKKLLYTFIQTCQESVVVRISDSEAGVIEEAVNALSQPNLTAALVSGFQMEWEANNSRCDECVKSDGVCGYNHTTGEFTCYCKDRPYGFMCGSDSPPSKFRFSSPPIRF